MKKTLLSPLATEKSSHELEQLRIEIHKLLAQEAPLPLESLVEKFQVTLKQLEAWARSLKIRVYEGQVYPSSSKWQIERLSKVLDDNGGQIAREIGCKAVGLKPKSTRIYALVESIPDAVIDGNVIVRAGHKATRLEIRRKTDLQKKKAIAESLRHLLLGTIKDEPPAALRSKLYSLWSKTNLAISVDGGSTNDECAKVIAKISTPSQGISNLTVITNAPDVADWVSGKELKKPTPHRVIQIGGKKRKDTRTYVGTLAEFSYDAMNLRPDLAVIAATELNSNGEFGSSDQDESQMKSRMLGPKLYNSVHAIALDSTKILRMKGVAWLFAAFVNIDMVVTDNDVLSRTSAVKNNENRKPDMLTRDAIIKHYNRFWELVRTHSLPVFVKNSFYLEPFD